MKTFVRLFKPRFAPLVEQGIKRQTFRPFPKRMPKAGDIANLREWTGKPYRSKQRTLMVAPIVRVAIGEVTETGVIVDSYAEPCDDFAKADGFESFAEMREWFKNEHGPLPFYGIVIFW